MSKPRAKWWGYVRQVLYAYPRMCDELSQRRADAVRLTPSYGQQGGGSPGSHGSHGSPVERAALVTLPPTEQRELDAVEAAIQVNRAMKDGALRLELIRLVFWKRDHTLAGAALKLHISYSTARRRQNEFIREVGRNMGLT